MSLSIVWQVLYWAWVVTEVWVLVTSYTRRSGGSVRDRGSLMLLWVVIFGSIWAGTQIGQTRPHTIFGGAEWVRGVSVALMAAGILIRWTAIVTLGKSFSVNVAIHATQTVKRTGIFRYVRHPSYTGLLIIFAAMGVHTRNWEALAIMTLPSIAALLYRIHVEEVALNHAFGADYADYSKSTKRLIPGIY
jgi:protein-S-isoprenylcysteine O-methyltransferase Ste14